MTQFVKKLPAVFQTVTEKKFFDATFDQIFSKKDSDLLSGYLGRRVPGQYKPITDFYLPEPSKDRTWWQLEATAFARDEDTTKTNILFYQDLLNRIEYYGGNTLNQDRLFESEYYSWAPPIDFDMFINYQNYYWIEQGLVTITITGVMGSDIIGQPSYTTPGTATPANLTLTTGMKIILTDDPAYQEPHTVENIGNCIGIRLVPQFPDFTAGTIFEFLPWDGTLELANGRTIINTNWDVQSWDTQAQPGNADYITIERGSVDRNPWSRTNKWFHIEAINATVQATGTPFPTNASRALRPIIQFTADLELYKSGTQFLSNISYGIRDDVFGNPILLSTYQGQTVNFVDAGLDISIQDGDLVVFMNDETLSGNPPYLVNQYVYLVSISAGIVTFSPYTSFATPVVDGDIVFVQFDAGFDGTQRGQTWYYDNAVWQQAYNDKVSTNQPPLFQLYDHSEIPLDDPIKYPNSNFRGNKIFSYKVNDEPGATVDPVLKFPLVYTSLGQASDIVFQNNLITDRYVYGNNLLPIDGYYYYTNYEGIVYYNSWNLYSPCPCDDIVPPPPCNCLETSKQRVIDRYVVGYGASYQFKLSVEPYGYPASPDLIVSVNSTEIKSAAEQVNGYTFVVINNSIYVDLSAYLSNLLLTTQSQPPVVEIATYTQGLLDPAATGYYEIPQQLEANPSNEEIGEISASNLIEQFSSIISNQIGFTGSPFGGGNNYRDSRKNRSLGAFILQNTAPLLKTMLISSSDDLDFIAGVRFSQDEYTKFKNKYARTALQLINQGFNPVQYQNNTIVVSAWVEEILKIVNVSKEFSNAFAYSYMIANGSSFANETLTVPLSGLVTLTNYVDLADPKNALYIYDQTGQERLLLIGVDYEIVSTNLSIDIQFNIGTNVNVGDTIFVAFYKNPLPAYIPSTPTKVGAYGAYIPRIELDESYAIPTNVIIGHDGSKTIAYGDYRDQLILELEKRIYNLLQYRFRNQYALPLRLESVKSGYFRQTRYSIEEFLDITESYINKWSAKNKANYRVNEFAKFAPTTPLSELWKLYNYTDAEDVNGNKLNLPGNWKGIFQYYYDTYSPDTRPWEMLGFSQEPSWWVSQYGTNWSSTNAALWADLEAGIIRQGPSAIFDPITLQPQPQEMWARPGLSAIIPVDALGQIIPVTTLFGVATSGNPYAPFDGFDKDWVYGDGGPVEQVWMSSSAYPFSVQEFLYLMRPGPFGEYLWDTIGTELSPGMLTVPGVDSPVQSNTNWQYVQNDNYTNSDPFFAWMRPKNADQVVHAESIDGEIQVKFGYQRWISDRILFLGKDVGTTFGQKVRTLEVNLANKLAGFTNKDTTNIYIESVTPGASTSNLIVPTNNFDVKLYKGQPVKTYAYSGVVIRALVDGTFAVYGYDLLNSEFIVLDRSNEKNIDVTIGGTPAEFQYFTPGQTYNPGDIVRYNGVYYLSQGTQTPQKFDPAAWQKLKALPIIGGISVNYRPVSLESYTKVPYGTILKSPQEVFDLLIGWGAYLETQGWKFEDVNTDTNQISDWLYSAKQFLFWLNTNWAPDASIQLSPAANRCTLVVEAGYPDDVESISNGVYSILDKYGVAIAPNNTMTDRDGPAISVEPSNLAAGGIYFLQVNASETEHVLIFDNVTSFNDVLYSPLLRARQQRLRFYGFRSNGWYGKMEAPGYLIIDNQLVPNFDTIVDEMRYYYDPDVTIDNPSLEDLGRHLIGYESKNYLDNLQVSNDVQYLFYQGAIRQKGTIQALDKLFRSTKVQSNETIQVFEEWALKLGDFGNTVEQVSTEFILRPEQNAGEVIVSRLNFVPSPIGFVKQINILNSENTYQNVPKVVISMPDVDPLDPNLTDIPRIAKAYAVLDALGRVSRIDITDPGYGYTSAPSVTLDSGAEPNNLDKFYAVWQGSIVRDPTLENIVEIDIDDTEKWIVRPTDPEFSLEFPTTNLIDYPMPNAGYINFNDVDWYSFDVDQTVLSWGNTSLNPIKDQSVWIAKTWTEDWAVYKMFDVTSSSGFDVIEGANGLQLRTDPSYLITPEFSTSGNTTDFGNLITLYINEAQATATVSAGSVSSLTITKTGINYSSVPEVTITGDGIGATAIALIAGGQVSDLIITNPGSGYTFANVTITPPGSVLGEGNYCVAFEFNQNDTNTDPTHNYYDLLTLDGTPISATDISNYPNFTNLCLFKTLRFETEPAPGTPSYVTVGDRIWVDNVSNKWEVFDVITPTISIPSGHQPLRVQGPMIDTFLFQSAEVFNARTRTELVRLPVYDPFKDILPGLAKQNITYISMQDPARYNVSGNTRLFSENITFGEAQVGKLWWDTSNTRYVYYEQPQALNGSETSTDNLVYRRDHWGQLFPGSAVEIYEWTKSSVPPAEYTGTGTPRSTTEYVQIVTSNRFTNIQEVNYYFWVLTPTDKPNIENRTMAALDVARLLQNPKGQGFAFFAPIQQTSNNNSYMFYNVQEILAYQGDNIQIKYRIGLRDDQEHTQWKFFREGDPASIVTDQYWNKLVDSLCGYTKVLPPSNEWSNSIFVGSDLPWDIYGWDIAPWDDATDTNSAIYGEILPVPDPALSSAEKYGIQYRPRQGMFVDIYAARKIFVQAGNSLLKHIPIRDDNPSWNTGVSTDIYWTYTTWYEVGYENVTPTVVFATLSAANAALVAGELTNGTIVQVTNGTPDNRFVMYAVEQLNPNIPTQSFKEVAIENSAIKLLDTIYTTKNLYGLSVEIRELMNAFRTQVFINDNIVDQNELYFSMLNYVLSEQKDPDWVFKSSYIYVKENNIPLTQDPLYIPDQIDNIIEYIMDAKPYHTQIRDYTSTYLTSDIAIGTASDSYLGKFTLTFGPQTFTGPDYEENLLDAMAGWDLNQGQFTSPWDTFNWDTYNIADVIDQFISRNPVLPAYSPGVGNPWPDTYTVPLTFFDVSKIGYSQLYPYTFDFNSLNLDNPQSFITPANIVAIQVGSNVLYYGQDYYVEYNNDTTYTVYFYQDPGSSPTPVAFVWWDGGNIMNVDFNTYRNEIALGYAFDDLVINVDTKLPVNNNDGNLEPYVGWGEIWEAVPDPVAQALIDNGGSPEISWDAPLNAELLPNTISFKQNTNDEGSEFYRNAEFFSGELVVDLPAPTQATENLDVIRVLIRPEAHPITTDILPEPGPGSIPGVIWIGGERIEYRQKTPYAANIWDLTLVRRGTMGTAPTNHPAMIPSLADPLILVPNPVWIEKDNVLPPVAIDTVWNVFPPTSADPTTETPPASNEYTSVENVAIGGLWYAETAQANFIKEQQGKSIP